MIRRDIIFKDFAAVKICYNGLLDYDTMQSGRQAGRYKHFRYAMPSSLAQQSLKLQTGTPIITHHFPKLFYFFILNDGTVYSFSTQLQDYTVS